MKIEEKKLPNGWEVRKLGEVCEMTSGGTPSRKNEKFYSGNIPWVKSGELDKGLILDTEEKITEEAIKNSSAKIFPRGTLLIALYGATIGKLAFLGLDAATNQAVCSIFLNKKINSSYLFNFLSFKKSELVSQGIGGAQPNISQGILKNLEIPLPPLSEQQAIVAKIEELFSELENGKQELLIAQAKLKTYRQSLLKWAFEGRLTNKNLKDGELPEGWEVKKLGEVCKKISLNGIKIKQKDYLQEGRFPVVDQGQELIGGYFNNEKLVIPNDPPYIIFGDHTKVKKFINFKFIAGADGVKVLKVNSILDPKFFFYLIHTVKIPDKGYARHFQFLEREEIPLPPLPEQQKIVAILESKLTICDAIEETIKTSINKCEALRQSILKKAFLGTLINKKNLP